jgi:hypothetical protein
MDDARRQAARLLCFGFDGPVVNAHAKKMIQLGAGAGAYVHSFTFSST